jgi:hypothetical protein
MHGSEGGEGETLPDPYPGKSNILVKSNAALLIGIWIFLISAFSRDKI